MNIDADEITRMDQTFPSGPIVPTKNINSKPAWVMGERLELC